MWTRKSELAQPGEYGTKQKPDGWVLLTVPELANQKIYLASENFSKTLPTSHPIPPENIVSLISPASKSKKGIPEEILTGQKGLAMFEERIKKIIDKKTTVLIHCKQGLNRTPVAAVLYLIHCGIEADRAVELVTQAYRDQRDPDFVLDQRQHYFLVLREAGVTVPAKRKRINLKR